jgi:hypothetical protein
MNPIEHAIYKLRNAQVLEYPFPHFFVHDVFPKDFYAKLLKALPGNEGYAMLPGGYKHRAAAQSPIEMVAPLESPYFASQIMTVFAKAFFHRYPNHTRPKFRPEVRFIRDEQGYFIGPHTDAPQKVVSLLFYLPAEYHYAENGTSIYVPDDHKKTCPGGPHYPKEGFSEVWRAPFVPNSCFGFFKTANSWHGVEEIQVKCQRDVMLFNIFEEPADKS